MAVFLVAGAVAWDRPIWLAAPLAAGKRVLGRSLKGQLEGRLGGGAANAGLALRAAGHMAAVHTAIADGPEGDALIASAQEAGLDLRFARRTSRGWRTTLILIEPDGERIILGLDPSPGGLVQDYAPLSAQEVQALAPTGLYLRAGGLTNAAALMAACQGPTVTHWPTDPESLACATILVGSRDDLGVRPDQSAYEVARAAGAVALRWAILTDGENPVCADDGAVVIEHRPPPAKVVDATGAGDVFAAGLLEALAAGAAMPEALAHGCRWGAAAVGLEASAPIGAGPDQFAPFS